MKYGFLALVLLALCAGPARAADAVSSLNSIEDRMAGSNPHGQAAPADKAPELPTENAPGGIEIATVPDPVPVIIWPKEPDATAHPGDEELAPGAEKIPLPVPIPPAHMANKRPMISIVIDDMGVDRKHSARAVQLKPEVTLSYLPYSPDIKQQTDDAKRERHELLVHVPMQPERKTADPGPNYLGTDMSPLELHERIVKNLSAFTGYIGINNHMGSKFTCDKEGLNVVMTALAERKLVFLDSRTSPSTVAEEVARAHHLKTWHRDVFIDNDESADAVAKSLQRIEFIAKHSGTAVAIGHPKNVTLFALEKWLPTLKDKGFDLVRLSTIIDMRNGGAAKPAVAAVASAAPPKHALAPAEASVTPPKPPAAALLPVVHSSTPESVPVVPAPAPAVKVESKPLSLDKPAAPKHFVTLHD